MVKYYFVQSHWKYGDMVTPHHRLERPIWQIRTEESRDFVVVDDSQVPIEDKEIEERIDMHMGGKEKIPDDCLSANTLEELIAKLKQKSIRRDE